MGRAEIAAIRTSLTGSLIMVLTSGSGPAPEADPTRLKAWTAEVRMAGSESLIRRRSRSTARRSVASTAAPAARPLEFQEIAFASV